MNSIEITTISLTPTEPPLLKAFGFCKNLNDILSKIKECHLFTNNYNAHKIYGKLYDSLSDSFDTLEEEIIGLVKLGNGLNFPANSSEILDIEFSESDYYLQFQVTINELFSILTVVEFEEFLDNAPKNGIRNTLEDIFGSINKSEYLLRMAITTSLAPESDNSGSVTQTGISTDSPNQIYAIRPTL